MNLNMIKGLQDGQDYDREYYINPINLLIK